MESEYDTEGAIETHQPCPDCGSSDALAVYEDHTHCFSCDAHHVTNSAFVVQQTKVADNLLPVGEFKDLPSRCLSEAICRKFGYSVCLLYTSPSPRD